MNDVKPWYASRTLWGAALAIVSGFVPSVGALLSIPGVHDGTLDALSEVGSMVGGAVAVWGRVTATTTIATPSNTGQ